MAFIDPDEPKGKASKFADPDDKSEKPDFLKKYAPYYMGPLGLPRMGRDALHALDAASYEAGGLTTDAATKLGAPPEVAAGLGTAANLATQSVPITLAGNVAKAAAPALSGAASWLMRSALKPTATSPAKGAKAVQTMLDDGYNVSEGSLDAMRARIASLNDEVEAAIAASNARVNKNEVASYTQDVVKKFENRPEALQAIKAAEDAELALVNKPMLAPGPTMSVQDAQRLKRGYQSSIGERGYGELKTPATEADKAIARGLREKISEVVPEVAPKNAKEAELINAAKRLQQRVAVEQNKNPIGIGAAITQPWMLPVWMWDRSAYAKSLVANGLYAGREQLPAGLARAGAAGLLYGNNTGQLYPEE
jgi:hypothetical protein